MSYYNKELIRHLSASGIRLTPASVDKMLQEGLLSYSGIRNYLIRMTVNELERGGTPRMEAMNLAAERLACSEKTVCRAIYTKR